MSGDDGQGILHAVNLKDMLEECLLSMWRGCGLLRSFTQLGDMLGPIRGCDVGVTVGKRCVWVKFSIYLKSQCIEEVYL